MTNLFCELWREHAGDEVNWINQHAGNPHEAGASNVDCSKLKGVFGWESKWGIKAVVEKYVEAYSVCCQKEIDVREIIQNQIKRFMEE